MVCEVPKYKGPMCKRDQIDAFGLTDLTYCRGGRAWGYGPCFQLGFDHFANKRIKQLRIAYALALTSNSYHCFQPYLQARGLIHSQNTWLTHSSKRKENKAKTLAWKVIHQSKFDENHTRSSLLIHLSDSSAFQSTDTSRRQNKSMGPLYCTVILAATVVGAVLSNGAHQVWKCLVARGACTSRMVCCTDLIPLCICCHRTFAALLY